MATAVLTQQEVDEVAGIAPTNGDPDKHYEVVNGQIVKEPPLGAREVNVATTLTLLVGHYVLTKKLGRMATEGLFILQHEPRLRRRPDVAFVSNERWPLINPVPPGPAWDVVPDLAIEVISPTDLATEVQGKIAEYLRAGVRLIWVVYVAQAQVIVYESATKLRVLKRADMIDGGEVLPGFQVPLAEVFETEADESVTSGDD